MVSISEGPVLCSVWDRLVKSLRKGVGVAIMAIAWCEANLFSFPPSDWNV